MAGNRMERVWVGGAAALALMIVVVGWFFLIAPQQDETADIEGRTADAQTQNLTLQARINQLGDEKKKRSSYLAALAKAQQALPDRSNMSLFLRDVQAIAGATSTRVTSLNVGEPTAVTPAAAPTGSTASPGAPGSATPQGQTAGLFAIPIDASVVGRTADLSKFLVQLQSVQPRAVLVTNVARNAATNGSSALQLKMNAFVAQAPTPTTSASPPGS